MIFGVLQRYFKYLFENEHYTQYTLPFRLRLLGTAAFPVGALVLLQFNIP